MLERRIDTRDARIAVLGLGYVGLPLAMGLASAGFPVLGVDPDSEKISLLQQHRSYILDVSSSEVAEWSSTGRFRATTDFSLLKSADAISICVPTPLRKTKDPDISYILSALEQIVRYQRPGQLIVLESTTYPGTTEEILLPQLTQANYTVGEDVFLAFSPERVDPGNPVYSTSNTPKVIGGVTPACARIASKLYASFIDRVIMVSSPKAAEMVKLLENTFRSVNIGMVNEFALMCDRLKLNVWEIIDAAASKPFGFLPFYPGPGLGGHCIPIDPQYLSWKMRSFNYQARFIELADAINTSMPTYVVHKVIEGLNQQNRCVKSSTIMLLGVTYKRNVSDTRESPALEIINELRKLHGNVCYHDPHCPNLSEIEPALASVPLSEDTLSAVDAVVIVADHSSFNYQWIIDHVRLVIDTRNATRGLTARDATIIRI